MKRYILPILIVVLACFFAFQQQRWAASSTAYNFKQAAELRDLLAYAFDTVNGHDHDGVNSKAVTTGTPAADAVDTAQIKAGALAASVAGRAKMADDYFNATTALAKFGADSITNAVLLKAVEDGAFVADASTRALFATGFMTPEKLSAAANTRVMTILIEDLAAGADIAARAILYAPTGIDITLVSADIIPLGSSAGVDDSNTAVIALADGDAHAIVSKTYNTGTQPPAAGVVGNLGSLDGTYKVLSAGEKLTVAVTQGTSANLPACYLQITYTIAAAA